LIYTCTLNPAIDLYIALKEMRADTVNRTEDEDYQPNGKGVNVSIMLKKYGFTSTALGFIAGFSGSYIEQSLKDLSIQTDFIPVDGITRINVFINTTEEYKLVNQGPAIEAKALDARKASDHYDDASFDRILIDAPCSGFGVIRRKPDMKYTKSSEDSARLATIQQSILHETAQLLKPGGTLVYSTCTMDPTENQQVIHAFLQEHQDFEPDLSLNERLPEQVAPFVQNGSVQILPHYFGTDGFFICSMRKKG